MSKNGGRTTLGSRGLFRGRTREILNQRPTDEKSPNIKTIIKESPPSPHLTEQKPHTQETSSPS